MSSIEMTIEQLASTVGMTVRNVRAYASRGLLPAPRLVGRKGYYGPAHASRLRLIRDLVDRGYTLGAVEKALEDRTELPDSHALDLLGLLSNPVGQPVEPERIDRATLASLAGIEDDLELREALVDDLVARGLVERVDDDTLLLNEPVLVRAGAQAMGIGLSRETVLALFSVITTDMTEMSEHFVEAVRREVWRPFLERGMPEEEWPQLVGSIETIIPVAVQAVVASFRAQLTVAIETAMGEELSEITGDQLKDLFG
jgi:DNA-binding transcriptional MerR regulator